MTATSFSAARPARSGVRSAGGSATRNSRKRGRRLLLAVDLGGTKALLGLFASSDAGQAGATPLHGLRLRCADFDGFEPLLGAYLDQAIRAGAIRAASQVDAACVALAGPVEADRARLTNLPWEIDATRVGAALAGASVRLVNDFVAAAAGIEVLAPGALRELQPGQTVADAPRLVVGAGTGLGTALVVPGAGGWRVLPGEGGHAGFAPRGEQEIALLRWLARGGARADEESEPHRRVSWEDVVSGAGIERVYRFLAESRARSATARWPSASEIADAAEAGNAVGAAGAAFATGATGAASATHGAPDAALSQATLDQFASAYGAFAGDAALLTLPRGGVYVAGGIAAKVFDAQRTAAFLAAFADKGPHARLLRALPVRLVLEPAVGLLGAAVLARQASETACRLS